MGMFRVALCALLIPTCASFRTKAKGASELQSDDILHLAGQGAAAQAMKDVALASRAKGPTTGAEAFNERGNVQYDENWFGDNCDLAAQEPAEGESHDEMETQFASTSDGQKQMKELIEQVNHMSLDGILRHLLSFYVCMRWVPDERFVKALKFELENVNIDSATKASKEPVSEEDILKMYASFDAIPMKCGRAMHVQDAHSIDKFLEAARSETSGLKKAYDYSEMVAEQALGFLNYNWASKGGRPEAVKEKLKQDARAAAEQALEVLPFDGFVRPSKKFTWMGGALNHDTHDSKAKNLFFVCFGPRVTSFPHKRENGPHVMADMNMAGCSGMWDLEDIATHVERVKKLFAPELCLTDDLRTKLKGVFLSTFMEMNTDFFQYMTGNFVQDTGFVEAIPQPLRESGHTTSPVDVLESDQRGAPIVRTIPSGTNIVLAGYSPQNPIFAKVAFPVEGWIENWSSKVAKAQDVILTPAAQGRVQTKYERTARLLAGAHTKWIVCDSKPASNAEVGFEDNFFRNPKAYAKWLDVVVEEKAPECKLMDPETGCVKCAIAVKSDPWRCNVRLGLEPRHILDALARGDFPLKSKYRVEDLVNKEEGKPAKLKSVSGTCLLGRKPSMNISRNNNLNNFAHYQTDDMVYQVTSDGMDHFTMAPRYTVDRRIKAHEKYLADMRAEIYEEPREDEIMAEVTAMRVWQAQFGESRSKHVNAQLGPVLAFEEHVPQQANRPSHFVQYIMSCPCEGKDFSGLEKAESFAGGELTDFFNAGG